MATIPNISVTEGKGSDFFIEAVVIDAENIEDFEVYFRMAEDNDPNSPTLISKNSTDPGEVVTISQNRAFIKFESSETDYASSIIAGDYYIEITLENAGGLRKLAGSGILTLVDTNIKLGS